MRFVTRVGAALIALALGLPARAVYVVNANGD